MFPNWTISSTHMCQISLTHDLELLKPVQKHRFWSSFHLFKYCTMRIGEGAVMQWIYSPDSVPANVEKHALIDGKSLQNSQTWLCFHLYLSLFFLLSHSLHTVGICKPSAHDKNRISGGSKFWKTFCHSQVGGYGCLLKVDEPWRLGVGISG